MVNGVMKQKILHDTKHWKRILIVACGCLLHVMAAVLVLFMPLWTGVYAGGGLTALSVVLAAVASVLYGKRDHDSILAVMRNHGLPLVAVPKDRVEITGRMMHGELLDPKNAPVRTLADPYMERLHAMNADAEAANQEADVQAEEENARLLASVEGDPKAFKRLKKIQPVYRPVLRALPALTKEAIKQANEDALKPELWPDGVPSDTIAASIRGKGRVCLTPIREAVVKDYVSHGMRTHVFSMPVGAETDGLAAREAVQELHAMYPHYDWTWLTRGRNLEIIATPALEVALPLPVATVRHLGNQLPWYIVPFGSAETTTFRMQTNSLWFWKMHDTPSKYVERTFDMADRRERTKVVQPQSPRLSKELTYTDMLSTSELECNRFVRQVPSAEHALIFGPKDGSQVELLKVILYHAVATRMTIYLHSATGDQAIQSMEALPEVKMIVRKVGECYEAVKRILYELSVRYGALDRLKIKHLPVHGAVSLGTRVALRDYIFHSNERVHVRIAGDERDIEAMDLQPGMEVVVRGDQRFRIPNHWECVLSDFQGSGTITFNPIIFATDSLSDLVQMDGDSQEWDELSGLTAISVPIEAMVREIRAALPVIAEYGRAVNIHLALCADDSVDLERLVPVRLRDAIPFRVMTAPSRYAGTILGTNECIETMSADQAALCMPNMNLTWMVHTPRVKEEDIIMVSGADKAAVESIKRRKIIPKTITPLRFEAWDGVLPDDMPVGVVADYGIHSSHRERTKVEGQSVQVGNRDIRINESSRVSVSRIQLTGLHGDNEEKRLGVGLVPEIPDVDEVCPQHETPTLDEFLRSAEVSSRVEPDAGRVDHLADGDDTDAHVLIVGDATSLNGVYSEVVDDEHEPFHIVK